MQDSPSKTSEREQSERLFMGLDSLLTAYGNTVIGRVVRAFVDSLKNTHLDIEMPNAPAVSVATATVTKQGRSDLDTAEPESSGEKPTQAFKNSAGQDETRRRTEAFRNRDRVLQQEKDAATGITSINLGRTGYYDNE